MDGLGWDGILVAAGVHLDAVGATLLCAPTNHLSWLPLEIKRFVAPAGRQQSRAQPPKPPIWPPSRVRASSRRKLRPTHISSPQPEPIGRRTGSGDFRPLEWPPLWLALLLSLRLRLSGGRPAALASAHQSIGLAIACQEPINHRASRAAVIAVADRRPDKTNASS